MDLTTYAAGAGGLELGGHDTGAQGKGWAIAGVHQAQRGGDPGAYQLVQWRTTGDLGHPARDDQAHVGVEVTFARRMQ
jgi:hypothetical protein